MIAVFSSPFLERYQAIKTISRKIKTFLFLIMTQADDFCRQNKNGGPRPAVREGLEVCDAQSISKETPWASGSALE